MKLKPLAYSVGALALAAVAAHFLTRTPTPPAPDARVGGPLVAPEILEQTQRIHLKDTGKSVDLEKASDGTWIVSSYHGLPADFSRLSNLTSSLSGAKLDRFIRGTPERLARLEFKESKIVLADAADKSLWSVTLGKTGENNTRFIRLGDEPNAFVSGVSVWLDLESKNWADSSLLRLQADEVLELKVPFRDGKSLTLSRAKADEEFKAENLPAGHQLKKSKITSLVSSLTNLRFSDTLELNDPKVVAAAHRTFVSHVKTTGGKTYTVKISQAAPPAPTPTPSPAAGVTPTPAPPPPANPVFVQVESSDTADTLSTRLSKRAFQVYEFLMTSLPNSIDEVIEPIPATPTPTPPVPTAVPAK